MRYSQQREAIRQVLSGCTDHPTAETIYERVRRQFPSVSLGTVYRNLNVLRDEGALITIESRERRVHYDGNTTPHRHFVCTKCNRVIDLFIETTVPEALFEMELTVQSEACIYYGLCRDCSHK